LENVLAICEHPSLIYSSESRMVYSAVTAEDATCVSSFDSAAYPGAIAIATADTGELKLAVVDQERTTHVETLAVNETVRRIAYSSSLKAFGLGTIKRILKAGVEEVQSHFKLVDEVVFQELHTFALNTDELIESCMRCELNDGADGLAERFVVGTAYLDEDSAESARGRILIFEVTESRQLRLVAEQALRGACRCLSMCQGNIVAALIKTVSAASCQTHCSILTSS
jgi:DNA damage-binding protein 1